MVRRAVRGLSLSEPRSRAAEHGVGCEWKGCPPSFAGFGQVGGTARLRMWAFRGHVSRGHSEAVPLLFAVLRKYNSHRLRAKVNISGINSCKWCKHPEREAVTYASLDLRQSVVQPAIHFKGIWKQASQWGLSLDVIKALVDANGSDSWDF